MSQAVPLLAIGAGVMGAGNALASGKAAQRAANFNAETMEAEARIAKQQGAAREEAQRRRAREFLGTQRAAAGQAGVGLGGSIGDVLEQSATDAELDALNIRYESNLQALGMQNQAAITRWQGKEAKRAARAQAITSLLSGAAAYGASGGINLGGGAAGATGLTPGAGGMGFTASGGTGFKVR